MTSLKSLLAGAVLCASIISASQASAATVTYTFTGTVSSDVLTTFGGDAGPGPLAGQSFVFGFTLDTTDPSVSVTPTASSQYIPNSAVTFLIGGNPQIPPFASGFVTATAGHLAILGSYFPDPPLFVESYQFDVSSSEITAAYSQPLVLNDANAEFDNAHLAFSVNGPAGSNGEAWTFDVDQLVVTNSDFPPVSATPLPATLPLMATGLGTLGLFGWHRRRAV